MTRLRPPLGAGAAAAAGSAFALRLRAGALLRGACSPLSAAFLPAAFFFGAGLARFFAGVAGVWSSAVFFRGATCDSSLVGACPRVVWASGGRQPPGPSRLRPFKNQGADAPRSPRLRLQADVVLCPGLDTITNIVKFTPYVIRHCFTW